MRPLRVDDKRFPLVYATMDGEQTDDDVEFYLERLADLNRRGERFALVTLIRRYKSELRHARRIGEWSKANEAVTARLCVGSATVIPSDMIRFMFASFYLIARVPFPFETFRSAEDAEAWAERKLREAGLAVPPKEL